MFKKITLFICSLALIIFGVVAFTNIVKATDLETDSRIVVNGAAVRTTGNAGLKFTASVGDYDTTNVSAYGIAIAFGTAEANNDFCVGGTVNGKSVLSATADELDAKDNFHVVLYGIPEASYLQDVTARAFVVDNGETIYGTTVTVRNLAEVTLKALNDGETGDLLTTVSTYISTNYKKAYDTIDGIFAVDNAAYCYDPTELGQLFVADWNKFVDEGDRIESISSNIKATAASLSHRAKEGADFYYSAKWTKWSDTTSTTDISESNLYRFFNDSFYGSKWGWLLTVMRTAENDAANAAWQAIAIQGDGTNSSKALYAGQHLCISIVGFFTMQKLTYGYTGVDFGSAKRNMYDNLYTGSYANTTVYNSYLRNHTLYKTSTSLNLPAARTPETGYEWVAYDLNSVNHAASSSYTVTSSNVRFKPKFQLVNYTISYLDGSTPLDLSPSSYTILTDTFSLPNYEKDNYTFDGWYDDAGFTEGPVTEIARGSHTNRTFYAKTTYTPYATVNVTLDLDGGNWTAADIISQNSPSKTVVATYYNSYHSKGYEISFVDSSSKATYWNYIVLEKTNAENVYRIIAKANGSANLPASYDAVISYHTDCTSEYFNDVKAVYNGSNIGQYITVENVPNSSGSGKNITIKLFPTAAFTADYVHNMIEPEELPVPIRTGYWFDGWISSLDSQVVDSFPGYNVNPGNITYTAQWSTVVPLNSADATAITATSPNKFVSSKFVADTYTINGNDYTLGTDLFTSISAAVSAATSGEKIYILPGKYDESVSITKSLSLYGSLYNTTMKHSDTFVENTATQPILTGTITVSGCGSVNMQGLVIKDHVSINGVSGINVSHVVCNSSFDGVFLFETNESSSAVFEYIYHTGSSPRVVYVQKKLTGLTFQNSAVLDGATVDGNHTIDVVRFGKENVAYAYGNIVVSNNYFRAAQSGFMDRVPNTATSYTLEGNYFKNIPVAIYFRSATVSISQSHTIRYNTFIGCGKPASDWDVLNITNGTNTTTNLNYNVFVDSDFGGTSPNYIIMIRSGSKGTFNLANNYFWDSSAGNYAAYYDGGAFTAYVIKNPTQSGTALSLWSLETPTTTVNTYDPYQIVEIGGHYYIYGINLTQSGS